MSKLIPPHGGKGLTCCLLEGAELDAEKKKAEGLKKITVSHREVGDCRCRNQRSYIQYERNCDWVGQQTDQVPAGILSDGWL